MALFRRNKVEIPKSPLGYALYRYDNIIKKDLKNFVDNIMVKKVPNARKVNAVLDDVSGKFDTILDDLSKENLKVDYRSDKIRYMIIDMINKLKSFFNKAKAYDFNPLRIEDDEKSSGIGEIMKIREVIRGKMKDIESDYL